ncbi:MAG: DUF4442 domain-containing protein, partial [Bdellovibrionales bacterium]|nr:DUF4442 domain-containing protein [Bdellovibrionales bacterium]
NHLRTIHACAMITAAEYCTGLYLLAHLSPKSYRLVMKEIKSEFVKRAIGPVSFKFAPEPAWLEVGKSRLATHQPWYAHALIEGTDSSGETVCRVQVQWQLKAWASSSHSVAL